ncbi:hypothetical protein JCM5353_006004 [Sporobolomyces roseus]
MNKLYIHQTHSSQLANCSLLLPNTPYGLDDFAFRNSGIASSCDLSMLPTLLDPSLRKLTLCFSEHFFFNKPLSTYFSSTPGPRLPLQIFLSYPLITSLTLLGTYGPSLRLLQTLAKSAPLLFKLCLAGSRWISDSNLLSNDSNEIFPEPLILAALLKFPRLKELNLGMLPTSDPLQHSDLRVKLVARGIKVDYRFGALKGLQGSRKGATDTFEVGIVQSLTWSRNLAVCEAFERGPQRSSAELDFLAPIPGGTRRHMGESWSAPKEASISVCYRTPQDLVEITGRPSTDGTDLDELPTLLGNNLETLSLYFHPGSEVRFSLSAYSSRKGSPPVPPSSFLSFPHLTSFKLFNTHGPSLLLLQNLVQSSPYLSTIGFCRSLWVSSEDANSKDPDEIFPEGPILGVLLKFLYLEELDLGVLPTTDSSMYDYMILELEDEGIEVQYAICEAE